MALSGTILPIHPAPEPDESLTSWLSRLSLLHHQVPATFFSRVFPPQSDALKQDLDLRCPDALIKEIAIKTGQSSEAVLGTTLSCRLNHLYLHNAASTALPRWVCPAYIRRKSDHHFGLKVCPQCLAESPHIRLLWRCMFYFACPKHGILLVDACAACGSPKSSRRFFAEQFRNFPQDALCYCHACGWDFREAAPTPASAPDKESVEVLLGTLTEGFYRSGALSIGYSHLFFDGVRLLMNGVYRMKNNQGSDVLAPLGGSSLPPQKHSELEFCRVSLTRQLLRAALSLLDDWPHAFLTYSRAHKLSFTDWVRPREAPPFWLSTVLREHLTESRYSPTQEELKSAANCLSRDSTVISQRAVTELLGTKSRPRHLSHALGQPTLSIDPRAVAWALEARLELPSTNIRGLVALRSRLFLALLLTTGRSYRDLCSLELPSEVTGVDTFREWLASLEPLEHDRLVSERHFYQWYSQYIQCRTRATATWAKTGGQVLDNLFLSSTGSALSVSLAVKSVQSLLIQLKVETATFSVSQWRKSLRISHSRPK
jgi:hypothetical protein